MPLSQLTFGLLIFPGVWDWYLQWREQRRGFYTKWEEDMLMVAQALTRAEVGWWIRQHPELLNKVQPIEGLIAPEEIQFAARDWDEKGADAAHMRIRQSCNPRLAPNPRLSPSPKQVQGNVMPIMIDGVLPISIKPNLP